MGRKSNERQCPTSVKFVWLLPSYVDGFEDSLKSCQCDWWNDSVEVCGLDGKTYWNSCLAKCKTEVLCEGACPCYKGKSLTDENCRCPNGIEKVCGANGETYNNECLAFCDDTYV